MMFFESVVSKRIGMFFFYFQNDILKCNEKYYKFKNKK